jgi:NADH dehydrogenase FAD-containing subunit
LNEIFNISKFLKGIQLVHKEVTKITETTIKLSDGIEMKDFDYLVISTGSNYDLSVLNVNTKEASMPVLSGISIDNLLKYKKEFEDAKRIAVVLTLLNIKC